MSMSSLTYHAHPTCDYDSCYYKTVCIGNIAILLTHICLQWPRWKSMATVQVTYLSSRTLHQQQL